MSKRNIDDYFFTQSSTNINEGNNESTNNTVTSIFNRK